MSVHAYGADARDKPLEPLPLARRSAEARQMPGFCTEHGVFADIEPMRADQIDAACESVPQGDANCRFVVNTAMLAA
ncbi:hypothetical protein [Xanthomonas tesorieronis]|uniref:hypothetical protein n=1 Tax=Xanthomonas tesorieronis TaxID=3160839 RepID=UPI0035152B34